MSFAYGTLIATPDGQRKIEDINIGDTVLASDGQGGWKPFKVQFSDGTGGHSEQPGMLYLDYGDDRMMISTRSQFFQLADGSIKRGDRLVPGQTQLVADGAPTPLHMLTLGTYMGGIHAIATDAPWQQGSLIGRLLLANGVATGDYMLELYGDRPSGPAFGTEEAAVNEIGRRAPRSDGII